MCKDEITFKLRYSKPSHIRRFQDFHTDVAEDSIHPGYDTASLGKWFRSLLRQGSMFLSMSGTTYQVMQCHILDKWMTHPHNWETFTTCTTLKVCDFFLLRITNKIQRYTIFFIIVNALRVSGGFSAHRQELKHCKHSIGYMPSLLAVAASKLGIYPMLCLQCLSS